MAKVTRTADSGASAPTITSGPTLSDLTSSSVVVSWSLDQFATGQVEYGPTASYGSVTVEESSFDYNAHSQTITGLTSGQLYHYRVKSTNAQGLTVFSSDDTFTPTPPVAGRPFPPPTITNTVIVNVGDNIQVVVNAAPDGTEFIFPAGATFTIPVSITLTNRHHLIFTGNGATIHCTATSGFTSPFKLDKLNSHIAINDFTIRGGNTNTGVNLFQSGNEAQHGVAIHGSNQIEVGDCIIEQVFGDGVYISGINTAPTSPSTDVWVHDNTLRRIGRMGMAFIAVENGIIERNNLDDIGIMAFDIEPDYPYEIIDQLYVQDNTVGSYGWAPAFTSWFFSYAEANGTASNIFVLRNVVTEGGQANANNQAGKAGLASTVQHSRVNVFHFKDNSSPVAGFPRDGYPAVLYFASIDGLVVTGNDQPLTSGALVGISDCPGAIITPNP